MDKGTLYHLRCATYRNVSASSEYDYNACDDFLVTVITSMTIAAALNYLQMNSVDDTPQHNTLESETWTLPDEERAKILLNVCKKIVLAFAQSLYQKPMMILKIIL